MTSFDRRDFLVLCAAGAWLGLAPTVRAASVPAVRLPDGTPVPALGMGSWHLGQGRRPVAEEEEAMRAGAALDMDLIDTAEMYGRGESERMISRVISGQRDRIFLVSKVLPSHATQSGIRQACEASLARLGTDYLDLYLLHWRGGSDLRQVVAGFEALREAGRIRHWGVSNFEVSDMEDLFRVPAGDRCATNQVRYNLADRAIESGVLPWCDRHRMPIMAYSPLGSGGGLLRDPALARVAAAHGCTPAAVALAWTIRAGNAMTIPEAGSAQHVRENAVAASLKLTADDLKALDAAFPPP